MAVSLDQVNTLATAIFRSRERSERYELRYLTKKGEIKMKSMNLFGDSKPKETMKPKKREHSKEFKELAVNLASKIGVTKAAEELGVSTSSIYSWQKSLIKSPTPVQDENSNLTFTLNTSKITTIDKDVCFSLEGRTYSLNVNSEEERKRVKKEVNANSLAKYDWFKEVIGKEHWVLYNTEMYEIDYDGFYCRYYLHYKEDCDLNPVIPINATSCYFMFYGCKSLIQLDFSSFDTSNVTTMYKMFYDCERITQLDVSNFDTSNVITMYKMFNECKALTELDLSNFNTSNVINMCGIFSGCKSLTEIDLSNFDTSRVTNMCGMFSGCKALTQLDLSSFNLSEVNYISSMFRDCVSLTVLDLSNFDTFMVKQMDLVFFGCKALTTIYISDKWNIDKVKLSDEMFGICYSLPNFNEEKIDAEMAKPVEQGGYLTLKR